MIIWRKEEPELDNVEEAIAIEEAIMEAVEAFDEELVVEEAPKPFLTRGFGLGK